MEIEASALANVPRSSLRFPEFKDGWLLFQSEETRKRLAPYPGDWGEMSAEQLERLCAQGRPERVSSVSSGRYPALNDIGAR